MTQRTIASPASGSLAEHRRSRPLFWYRSCPVIWASTHQSTSVFLSGSESSMYWIWRIGAHQLVRSTRKVVLYHGNWAWKGSFFSFTGLRISLWSRRWPSQLWSCIKWLPMRLIWDRISMRYWKNMDGSERRYWRITVFMTADLRML